MSAEHTSNAPHASMAHNLYRELCQANLALDQMQAQMEILGRQRDEALDERDRLRGAMEAQDRREIQAGARCGVPYEEAGCDWPDAVVERLMATRAECDRLRIARVDEFGCGCSVAVSPGGSIIRYCALHESAPGLRDVARAFLLVLDRHEFSSISLRGKELDAMRRLCE